MQGFRQQDDTLIWESNHETVRIEPWGRDSLRVRATVEPAIRDDLPGALLDPAPTSVQIEIGDERTTIRNGTMMAEVSQTGWAGLPQAGKIRFLNAVTGAELLEDQFMFGPDLLAAPVLYEGARSRPVYLPAGASWTDAWTGAVYAGGQPINADVPLAHIPLYLRDGAQLPIQA